MIGGDIVRDPDSARERLGRADAKVIAAAVLGWTIDMFDLLVILHVAGHVSRAFFPSDNEMLGFTATYAAFAVSLLVRPLGALLLGSLSDRSGRRVSMMIGVLGAGAATAAMGALPGVVTIGLAAPVLFIVLRIVQGIFVGGIAASTHTIATETVPERFRGMTAGLIKGGGASLAVVVINVLVLGLTAAFGSAAFAEWGWRILFAVALLGAFVNYFVLRGIEESPLWLRRQAQIAHERDIESVTVRVERPGRELFSARWRTLVLTSAAIVFAASAPYYLTTGILPTVYKNAFHLSQSETSSFLIINVVGSAIVAVVCGHLSQHIGRKRLFLGAGVACLVLIPGLYAFMWYVTPDNLAVVLICSATMVMASGAISAPLIIFLNERFPTELRSTATAFAWNIGYGLSGMMPTLVTALSAGAGSMVPVLIVLSLLIAVGFLVLIVRADETRGALSRNTVHT
ncbi:MFS transporter [Nocardia callitridis]|uniref:MFS transporter n=1 Tax=Nocardia callitridis TaxID=648753 RepID=A0ABP9K835_9NOCA